MEISSIAPLSNSQLLSRPRPVIGAIDCSGTHYLHMTNQHLIRPPAVDGANNQNDTPYPPTLYNFLPPPPTIIPPRAIPATIPVTAGSIGPLMGVQFD